MDSTSLFLRRARPNVSQFQSIKIRGSMFLIFVKFADRQISVPNNCEMFDQVGPGKRPSRDILIFSPLTLL